MLETDALSPAGCITVKTVVCATTPETVNEVADAIDDTSTDDDGDCVDTVPGVTAFTELLDVATVTPAV